jgi:hypothetical protein
MLHGGGLFVQTGGYPQVGSPKARELTILGTMKQAKRYAFGRGWKTTGQGPEKYIYEGDCPPPATEMEVALVMGYRATHPSPDSPDGIRDFERNAVTSGCLSAI